MTRYAFAAQGWFAWIMLLLIVNGLYAQTEQMQMAKGRVFIDTNNNRLLDEGEKGLPNVRVSNGREPVLTNEAGEYEIAVSDDCIVFVVKPQGYRSPLSQQMTPEFYYIHKPHGSPELKFPGVEPTGDLPESIDFPLYPQDEPEVFRALMFGDPQPRDQKEIDYIAHDVIEELVGVEASLGVTLGDILFDDLSLFESQGRTIALLGVPWYNVIGNHDINYDAKDRRFANETYERFYGPSYYSFDHGQVHFLVLDDIDWVVPEEGSEGKPHYEAGLGEDQLEFIRRDLELVPENRLLVLMMHIPITQIKDRESLFRLIEQRPFCMSISGHTHHHEHQYLKEKDGWNGPQPHHHVINVTVSGSWWSGGENEWGIPHTTMADGAPNGYSIVSFDGTDYRVDYRAAGRPANYQMNITAPEAVTVASAIETTIWANVFNGSEKTKVQMRIGKTKQWVEMERTVEVDPGFAQAYERDQKLKERATPQLTRPKPSTHLWKANLPANVEEGPQLIHIRAIDDDGRTHDAYRVIRVNNE